MLVKERRAESVKERLDGAFFSSVRQRVFRDSVSTLDDEAAHYSMDDLRLALGVVRVGMRSEIEWLPERAFEEQPVDDDGHEVWNAGQVVNHVGHTQIGMSAWLQQALGLPIDEAPHPLTDLTDAETPGMLSREQALHVLDVADRELETLFDDVPAQIERAWRASHPAFGEAGIKGGLLLMAIHEHDHLEQLIDLRF